jgi:hypothetical protein
MVFAKHAVKFVRPDQAVVAETVKVKKPRAKKEAAPAPEVAAPAPETPKVKKVRKAKIAPTPDTSAITPMTAPPVLEADVAAPIKAKKQKLTPPAPVAAVPATPSEPAAKPAKKKRAPTAYNIAVGKHMKAGKTMKEAAALAKTEIAKNA